MTTWAKPKAPETPNVLRSWRRVRLTTVRETTPEPYGMPKQIRSGIDVVQLVRALIAEDPREHFVAVYLDVKHVPIAVHVVSIGTVSASTVHPREVFGPALAASASRVIVAHNHPSGDPTPSPEDRLVTDRLRAAGELLGVGLLDHIVLGAGRFFSFTDDQTRSDT